MYCAHGGISPYMIKMEQLDKAVQRPAQINSSTSPIVIDTLWADPSEHIDMWGPSSRGLSHQFGLRAARMFMKANGLKRIIRGHSAQNSGYNILGNDEVITVFSSPNYCNSGNDGAVMVLGSDGNFAIDLLRMDSLDSKMKWSSDELLRTDILIE